MSDGKLTFLGGEKYKTIMLTDFSGWMPRIVEEKRPWYEGHPRRFGKYTKQYADGRQKKKRKRKRRTRWHSRLGRLAKR